MEDAKSKILTKGTFLSVSKTISDTSDSVNGWIKAGLAPAAFPNSGFLFCPEFKLDYYSRVPSDVTIWDFEVTYIIATKGFRMMNTV